MLQKANPLKEKSYAFALQIVAFTRLLMEKKEFVLSKQLLKSGTSVGANVEEASQGQSRNDFVSKLSIALKETFESIYWLRLIRDSTLATGDQVESLLQDAIEIRRLLIVIIKTTKQNNAFTS